MRLRARHRRWFHLGLLGLWLGPGTALWLLLRDELWFVGFMSIYAIWATHLAAWAAETPVEAEAGA